MTPENEVALEYSRCSQDHLIEENRSIFCQQVSMANIFFVRGWTLLPFPLLCPEILSFLTLYRSYTWYHSLCEFIYAPVIIRIFHLGMLVLSPMLYGFLSFRKTFASSRILFANYIPIKMGTTSI